tara:strand:- start:2037 stop:2408 length:372 start_codon:yes stop_codon:yes gene_type:complete
VRSDKEYVEDCYDFHDMFLHSDLKENESGTDISRGLFGGDCDKTPTEEMQNKYETYLAYLKLQPGSVLLEYGCGNCQWLHFCSERGVKVEGITLRTEQRGVYEEKLEQGKWLRLVPDAPTIPT